MDKKLTPFTWVTIDISGVCNAKCKYCATGSRSANPGGMMSLELFKKTLDRVIELGAAKQGVTAGIALFNKGEPFLNPNFSEILDYIISKGFKFNLSSNCSVYKELTKEQVNSCINIIISVPGWSQESYDKVHQFDFEKIKENISLHAKNFGKYKQSNKLNMTYHIYQYNLNEIFSAVKFAIKNKIDFNPYYAHIIDYWKIKGFVQNNLSDDLMLDIRDSLFISHIDNGLKDVPEDYVCPQSMVLNLDENADILTCCVLPNNHDEYKSGSIFDDNAIELIMSRQDKMECNYCKKSGISKLLTTYEGTPHFVRQLEELAMLEESKLFKFLRGKNVIKR